LLRAIVSLYSFIRPPQGNVTTAISNTRQRALLVKFYAKKIGEEKERKEKRKKGFSFFSAVARGGIQYYSRQSLIPVDTCVYTCTRVNTELLCRI
jgi:hypothetical protein